MVHCLNNDTLLQITTPLCSLQDQLAGLQMVKGNRDALQLDVFNFTFQTILFLFSLVGSIRGHVIF